MGFYAVEKRKSEVVLKPCGEIISRTLRWRPGEVFKKGPRFKG